MSISKSVSKSTMDHSTSTVSNDASGREAEEKLSDHIPFGEIVKNLERISKETDTKKKKAYLDKLVRYYRELFQNTYGTLDCEKAGGDSLYPLYRILLAKHDRGRGAYGFKSSVLSRMFTKVLGIDKNSHAGKVLLNFKDPSHAHGYAGDVSHVIYEVMKERFSSVEDDPNRKVPSLTDIHNILDKLARGRGPSDVNQEHQRKILQRLVQRLTALEVKWLVRILLKEMHLGLTSTVIFGLLHKQARSLSERIVDLEVLCKMLNDPMVDVSKMGIMMFNPFSPMLSTRMDIIDSVHENNNPPFVMDNEEPSTSRTAAKPKRFVSLPAPPFYVETKWDGERFQIHYDGVEFKYFSRRAFDFSEQFNETFTPHFQPRLSSSVRSFIIDGEMMAFNKHYKLFTQKGYNIDVKTIKKDNPNHCPVFVAFDLVYLNGEVITKVPLKERREKLIELFQPKDDVIRISEVKVMNSKQEVIDCLDAAIDDGEEGLIVKSMISNYTAGQRGPDWLKIKPEYLKDNSVNDLDLLILGAYYTESNRRGGEINHFLLGVIDKDAGKKSPEFYPVAKVGTGRLRSIAVKELVQKLKPKFVKPTSSTASASAWNSVIYKQRKRPDFLIKPGDSIVVQVKASEIIPSDVYALGYTLRFPRIVKTREDKSPNDIMTTTEFHTLRETCRGKLAKRSDADGTQGRPYQRKRRYNSFSGAGTKDAMEVDYDTDSSDSGPSPKKQPLTAKRANDIIFRDDDDDDSNEPGTGPLITKKSSSSRSDSSPTKSSSTSSAATSPVRIPQKHKVFDSKVFCVHGRSVWKTEIEKQIRLHGGSITQNADVPELFCIIGESKKSPRIMKAIQSGKYDILPGHASSWLMLCIKEGKEVPLKFKHYWAMTPATRERLKEDEESYSDSYSVDTEIDEKRDIENGEGDGADLAESQSCLAEDFSNPSSHAGGDSDALCTPKSSATSVVSNAKNKSLPVKKKRVIMTFDDDDDDSGMDQNIKDNEEDQSITTQDENNQFPNAAVDDEDSTSTDFSGSELPDKSQDSSKLSGSGSSTSSPPKEEILEATTMATSNAESEDDDSKFEVIPESSFMSEVDVCFRGTISPKIVSKFKRCGGRVLEDETDETVTHVVICNKGEPSRKDHSRAFVVSQKWLEDCLLKGEVLEEWGYRAAI